MLLRRLSVIALLCAVPAPALAWKPTTHVYLATQAAADALDDGEVSITNLESGETFSYGVAPEALEALQSAMPQYRAGVLGPDAYPDLMTGQQVIHPEEAVSGVPSGSDAWLQHVWGNFGDTPQEWAFRLGFLTHAAGDVFGHSFINYFTGAPFEMIPPDNAIKHVVLEGYIDKRLPAGELQGDFFDASISGLEGKIYSAMVDARPGTTLDGLLPSGSSTDYSIPRIFSTLRAELETEIAGYYAHKEDLKKQIDDCDIFDFSCSATALTAELAEYMLVEGTKTTYKEHWLEDIDDGLREWPGVSHEVALALFFNPDRSTKTGEAKSIMGDYVTGHLLSMAGAPDFVGMAADAISAIVEAVTPDFLLEPIRRLKDEAIDAMLEAAFGMTRDEIEKYLTQPDQYFDEVMSVGDGENVTLADFNANYLGIADPGYDSPDLSFAIEDVPAAYNTVVLSKLILLAPETVNQVIADLGGSATLSSPNIMLGFAHTLDGSNQWSDGLVLAEDCAVYQKVFMTLPGQTGC